MKKAWTKRVPAFALGIVMVLGLMPVSALAEATEAQDLDDVTGTAAYTVTFDTNGGDAVAPITVTYGEKYGTLPTSSITGLSGDWYLVDGDLTETKITAQSTVNTAGDHTLRMVRKVAVPALKLTLAAPGCLSADYPYYNPEDSTRILTVTVSNMNEDVLAYSYQWYQDGELISGENSSVLTLEGNVSDSGTYKVAVTATLKDGTGITVTENTASRESEKKITIRRASNTVYYDANGGTGGASSNYTGSAAATVSKNAPQREGYTFAGWNTAADGSGESYSAGSTYTFANDNGNGGCRVTLYAQWTVDQYTVTLMANDGSGATEIKTVEAGRYSLPDCGFTAAGCKVFDGWDLGKPGDEITVDSHITLTAQWKDVPHIYENGRCIGCGAADPGTAATPVTGDSTHVMLWFTLLFVSGSAIVALTVIDRKRSLAEKR